MKPVLLQTEFVRRNQTPAQPAFSELTQTTSELRRRLDSRLEFRERVGPEPEYTVPALPEPGDRGCLVRPPLALCAESLCEIGSPQVVSLRKMIQRLPPGRE
jgi:hypothetical protein